MQYRLTLWDENSDPSAGPVWEEISPDLFHRFEKGDVIATIHSYPKQDLQNFVISRVEYGFQGLGTAREMTQNVFFKADEGGSSN